MTSDEAPCGRQRKSISHDDRSAGTKACANWDGRYAGSDRRGCSMRSEPVPHWGERAAGAPVRRRYSRSRPQWQRVSSSHSSPSLPAHCQNTACLYAFTHIIQHRAGDIDAGRSDAVAKLHGGIDLVDEQAALAVFQHINGQDTAANRLRRSHTQFVEFGCDGAVAGGRAARRVGDPVRAVAIDGADGALADDEGADVAQGLIDILLNIMDVVLVRAKRLLMFQHSLRRVAVVDARQQTPPRAGNGLKHCRIAQRFDAAQGRFGREGQQRARHRHPGAPQRQGGQQLIVAGGSDGGSIENRHAPAFQHVEHRQAPRLADAATQHGVECPPAFIGPRQIEQQFAIVDYFVGDAALLHGREKQLLFHANARGQNRQMHRLTLPSLPQPAARAQAVAFQRSRLPVPRYNRGNTRSRPPAHRSIQFRPHTQDTAPRSCSSFCFDRAYSSTFANKNALRPRRDEERHLLSWYHPHSLPPHDGQPRRKDYRNSPYAPANGGEPAQVYSHHSGDFCWRPTGLFSRRGTYGLRSSRPLSACPASRYSSHHRFCAMQWCFVSQGRGQIKTPFILIRTKSAKYRRFGLLVVPPSFAIASQQTASAGHDCS